MRVSEWYFKMALCCEGVGGSEINQCTLSHQYALSCMLRLCKGDLQSAGHDQVGVVSNYPVMICAAIF